MRRNIIETYPPEIIELACRRQSEQGNPVDIERILFDSFHGGFDWVRTEEGHDFWEKTFHEEIFKFNKFFEKYPKNKTAIRTM